MRPVQFFKPVSQLAPDPSPAAPALEKISGLIPYRRRSWISKRSDSLYITLLFGASAFVLLLVLAIVIELFMQSRLSMHTFGTSFVTGNQWNPVKEEFSMRVFALGTLYTSFWALLISVPISIGAAIFLAEVAPKRIRSPLGFFIESLASIPSVVYGLWGIFVLVPWLVKHVEGPISESRWGSFFLFNAAPNGNDFLAAALILSIMIIPIITGIARAILQAVPNSLREGSYALGATKWETIRGVVLPRATGGLIGAVMLGLGRALGETMAVTMVIGNNNSDFNLALFSPGATMSSVIANEFTEATLEIYRSALMEIGFALLVIAVVINGAARLLVRWTARSMEGARR